MNISCLLVVINFLFLILPSNSFAHQQETNFGRELFQGIDFERESLRKSPIRIHALNYPPVMVIVIDSGNSSLIEYRGIGVDFVNYLAQHYDLIIEYIPENPGEVAKFGQILTAVNAVISDKVDLAPIGLLPTPERWKMFDMTMPAFSDPFKLLVKWPDEMSRLAELAKPFDTITWWMLAASFIAIIGLLSLISVSFRDTSTNGNSRMEIYKIVSDGLMFVVGIATNQGQKTVINGKSRYFLLVMLGFWLLMMVVLINSYIGVLNSYMAVPKLKPIPQSLEELATMKQYRVTIMKSNHLANIFSDATVGPYKILGDTLRQNPELLFSKFSQAVENVLKFNAVNVDVGIVISIRIAADLKMNNGSCRLTTSNPISHTQTNSLPLPKNSRFTKTVDQDLSRSIETGLYEFWKKRHTPSMDKCNLNQYQGNKGKPKAIRFIELSSAFLILGVGVGLSILIYLVERIVSILAGKKYQN